jgi:hypothetical protein
VTALGAKRSMFCEKDKTKTRYLSIRIHTRTPDAPATAHQQRMVPSTRSMHNLGALDRPQVLCGSNPPRRILRNGFDAGARAVGPRNAQARSAVPSKEPRLAVCIDAHKVASATRSVDRGGVDVEEGAEEVGFEEVWGEILGRVGLCGFGAALFAAEFWPGRRQWPN